MKESKLKHNRVCKSCRRGVWGDAEALKAHSSLHRFVARSGITVVERRVSAAPELVDARGRSFKNGYQTS